MITRHRGDHFVVYTNITTLRYIPETNVISVIPQLKKKNLSALPWNWLPLFINVY